MRTSGFDLASADERTAGCIVGWTESVSRPLALLRPLDNATVVELARDVEIVASTLRWDGLRPDDHARDGSNGLLEVYPAAALKRWSLSSRGYKLPENTAERLALATAGFVILGWAGSGLFKAMEVAPVSPSPPRSRPRDRPWSRADSWRWGSRPWLAPSWAGRCRRYY